MTLTEDDKKILESLGWVLHHEGGADEYWHKYSTGGPCHGHGIAFEGSNEWHSDIANHLEHLRFAKRTYK